MCLNLYYREEDCVGGLAGDACSRPPITIRSHYLHVGDIRRAVGEIISYHKRD